MCVCLCKKFIFIFFMWFHEHCQWQENSLLRALSPFFHPLSSSSSPTYWWWWLWWWWFFNKLRTQYCLFLSESWWVVSLVSKIYIYIFIYLCIIIIIIIINSKSNKLTKKNGNLLTHSDTHTFLMCWPLKIFFLEKENTLDQQFGMSA